MIATVLVSMYVHEKNMIYIFKVIYIDVKGQGYYL